MEELPGAWGERAPPAKAGILRQARDPEGLLCSRPFWQGRRGRPAAVLGMDGVWGLLTLAGAHLSEVLSPLICHARVTCAKACTARWSQGSGDIEDSWDLVSETHLFVDCPSCQCQRGEVVTGLKTAAGIILQAVCAMRHARGGTGTDLACPGHQGRTRPPVWPRQLGPGRRL